MYVTLARGNHSSSCERHLAYTPTKLHLLSIDFAIIVLNTILTTIAYETSLYSALPTDAPDPLLPLPPPSTPSTPILFSADDDEDESPKEPSIPESPYVLDLRLSHIVHRLRHPAPPPPERELTTEDLLPLPNTTPWQFSNTLQILMQARARARQRARSEADARRTQAAGEEGERRTVPGGLDST